MARGGGETSEQAGAVTRKPNDWFSPSWAPSPEAAQTIADWVSSLEWPAGTELKGPETYHVTAFYARSGYSDPANHAWIRRASKSKAVQLSARAARLEIFDAGDGDEGAARPVVLVLEAPELVEQATELQADARKRGLEPQIHSDGYNPHLTIAYATALPANAELPGLEIPLGWLYEHHALRDEQKKRAAREQNS